MHKLSLHVSISKFKGCASLHKSGSNLARLVTNDSTTQETTNSRAACKLWLQIQIIDDHEEESHSLSGRGHLLAHAEHRLDLDRMLRHVHLMNNDLVTWQDAKTDAAMCLGEMQTPDGRMRRGVFLWHMRGEAPFEAKWLSTVSGVNLGSSSHNRKLISYSYLTYSLNSVVGRFFCRSSMRSLRKWRGQFADFTWNHFTDPASRY